MCAALGHSTWPDLVLANFDFVVDGLVLQLQQPERYPCAAPLLAALFKQAPVTPALLPALAEPAACAIQNLSILSRFRWPQHTRSFLVGVLPIVQAAAEDGHTHLAASKELARWVSRRLEAQQDALFDKVRAAEQAAECRSAQAAEPVHVPHSQRSQAGAYFEAHHGGEPGLAEGGAAEQRERASKVQLSADAHDLLRRRMARVASSSELTASACQAAAPLLLAEDLALSVAAHALVKVRSHSLTAYIKCTSSARAGAKSVCAVRPGRALRQITALACRRLCQHWPR